MKELTTEIERSVNLLFQTLEKNPQKKSFLDKGRNVYLQVGIFKIPFITTPRRKYLKLCHSLYGDDPDICLFVPNRKTDSKYKKTTDEFIDFCVDYYTEFLEKHKVKGINTIMPVKQLKAEYGTYELRRKLVQRFDLFLCKNSLLYNPRFLSGLGKIFSVANKDPLGVSFPDEKSEYDSQFQKNVDRALFASSFYIKPSSDNYTIPVGTLSNTKQELKENIKAVLEQILNEDVIPGGFNNIKTIYLWPSQSKAIPLYTCLELPEKIKFKSKKGGRKVEKNVEGDLSTLPNKKVTVMRNGDVFVTNLDGNFEQVLDFNDEDDESFDDGSEEEEEYSKNKKDEEKNKNKLGGQKKEIESESEDEDDDIVEENEERLLRKTRESGYSTFELPKSGKKNSLKKEDEKAEEDDADEDDEKEEYTVKNKKIKLEEKQKNSNTQSSRNFKGNEKKKENMSKRNRKSKPKQKKKIN